MNNWDSYLGIFPYVVGLLVLLAVARKARDLATPFNDNQAMINGNIAATMGRAGWYVGVGLAAAGSLISRANSYWEDLGYFMLDGVIAIVFFTAASYLLDRVVLRKVDNERELERDNRAMGVVELFTYPAIGAILMGSFAGEGTRGYGQEILSALLFSVLGLAVLLLAYWAYDYYRLGRDSSLSLDKAIVRGNVSAALDVGSTLLALGIVLSFSIAGPFTGWVDDIESYFVAVPFALAALMFSDLLMRLLLAPRLQKGNNGMGLAFSGVRAALLPLTGVIAGLNII